MRTITLHNIRYERQWRGDELWLTGHGREQLVGSVRRSADGGRWEVIAEGFKGDSFQSESVARQVLEGRALALIGRLKT